MTDAGPKVRGMVHDIRESRPLAEWVKDIRAAVAQDPAVAIVLPSGDELQATEWLAAWDAEQGRQR